MKLGKITTEVKNPIEGLYDVEEIMSNDIAAPSEHFLKYIREHSGFSFLNIFTIKEFTKKVQQRFVNVE